MTPRASDCPVCVHLHRDPPAGWEQSSPAECYSRATPGTGQPSAWLPMYTVLVCSRRDVGACMDRTSGR